MSVNISNDIQIKFNSLLDTRTSHQVRRYLDDNIDFNGDHHHIHFTTHDWHTGCFIAECISSQCENSTVHLSCCGDYYIRYYVEYTYYNGKLTTHKEFTTCDCKIQVPHYLGYEENVFETFAFIPELFGIDRNDSSAVAADVLKKAIAAAPSEAGRLLLRDPDSEEFKNALNTANESLVMYYDPYNSNNPAPYEAKTNEEDTASSGDTSEIEDFPF